MTLTGVNNYKHILYAFSCCFAPILYGVTWVAFGMKEFPWDGNWYRGIAEHGYEFNGDIRMQSNVAFLPGYPILIYIFSLIPGLGLISSQFAASCFSYFIGALFFLKYLERKINWIVAAVFVFLFSIGPFSIYLFNGYSEALFFGLCGAFFYYLARQKYYLCALIVSYALITRPHAIVLAIVFGGVLLFHFYKMSASTGGNGLNRVGAACASCFKYLPFLMIFPASLTLYYFYKFDDSLAYVNALYAWSEFSPSLTLFGQFNFFRNSLLTPIDVSDFKNFSRGFITPLQFSGLYVLLQIFTTFWLVINIRRCCVPEAVVFCLLIVAFGTVTGSAVNMGRHYIMAFSTQLFIATLLGTYISEKLSSRSEFVGHLISGFLLAGISVIYIMHFFIYSIRQINGVWIS